MFPADTGASMENRDGEVVMGEVDVRAENRFHEQLKITVRFPLMIFKTDSTDPLTRGTVFKGVARLRFAEAEVLQRRKHLLGAVYLAGYAIECHLK